MRGLGSLFQRRKDGVRFPTWWIKYSHRGRIHRESSGTTDRRHAERFLKRRIAEVGADRLGVRAFAGPQSERFTVAQMLDDYAVAFREKRGLADLPPWMRTRVPHLVEFLGDERAFRVDSTHIEAYKNWRRERSSRLLAVATINRELQILRAAFNHAIKRTRKIYSAPYIQLADESGNVRRVFFGTTDFEQAIKHLPGEFQDFARFAFWTGMRKGGVAALRWADVNRRERTLLLRPEDDKAGHGVPLKLPPYLWTIIERRWTARVVPTPDGPRMSEWIFHRRGFQAVFKSFDRHWKKALERAGIPAGKQGYIFHDLRRTAVRNMRHARVPTDVIMKVAGMRTESIFHRYNIVDERDIEEALEMTVQYVDSMREPRKILPLTE